MKKILVINGSPNKNGHTKTIVEDLLSTVDEKDIEIVKVDCYAKKINPCIDCKCCSRKQGQCSIKDDMESVYNHLKECDIVILASPMYFGMFPAPLKALIDRCQLIWSEKYIFNKTAKPKQGIVVFDSGIGWNNMYIPMETIAKYFFNTINCSIAGRLYITNTDEDHDYINNNASSIECCKEILNRLITE